MPSRCRPPRSAQSRGAAASERVEAVGAVTAEEGTAEKEENISGVDTGEGAVELSHQTEGAEDVDEEKLLELGMEETGDNNELIEGDADEVEVLFEDSDEVNMEDDYEYLEDNFVTVDNGDGDNSGDADHTAQVDSGDGDVSRDQGNTADDEANEEADELFEFGEVIDEAGASDAEGEELLLEGDAGDEMIEADAVIERAEGEAFDEGVQGVEEDNTTVADPFFGDQACTEDGDLAQASNEVEQALAGNSEAIEGEQMTGDFGDAQELNGELTGPAACDFEDGNAQGFDQELGGITSDLETVDETGDVAAEITEEMAELVGDVEPAASLPGMDVTNMTEEKDASNLTEDLSVEANVDLGWIEALWDKTMAGEAKDKMMTAMKTDDEAAEVKDASADGKNKKTENDNDDGVPQSVHIKQEVKDSSQLADMGDKNTSSNTSKKTLESDKKDDENEAIASGTGKKTLLTPREVVKTKRGYSYLMTNEEFEKEKKVYSLPSAQDSVAVPQFFFGPDFNKEFFRYRIRVIGVQFRDLLRPQFDDIARLTDSVKWATCTKNGDSRVLDLMLNVGRNDRMTKPTKLMEKLIFSTLTQNFVKFKIWCTYHSASGYQVDGESMTKVNIAEEKVSFVEKNAYVRQTLQGRGVKEGHVTVKKRSLFLNNLPATIGKHLIRLIYPHAVDIGIVKVNDENRSAVVEMLSGGQAHCSMIGFTDVQINGHNVQVSTVDKTQEFALEEWKKLSHSKSTRQRDKDRRSQSAKGSTNATDAKPQTNVSSAQKGDPGVTSVGMESKPEDESIVLIGDSEEATTIDQKVNKNVMQKDREREEKEQKARKEAEEKEKRAREAREKQEKREREEKERREKREREEKEKREKREKEEKERRERKEKEERERREKAEREKRERERKEKERKERERRERERKEQEREKREKERKEREEREREERRRREREKEREREKRRAEEEERERERKKARDVELLEKKIALELMEREWEKEHRVRLHQHGQDADVKRQREKERQRDLGYGKHTRERDRDFDYHKRSPSSGRSRSPHSHRSDSHQRGLARRDDGQRYSGREMDVGQGAGLSHDAGAGDSGRFIQKLQVLSGTLSGLRGVDQSAAHRAGLDQDMVHNVAMQTQLLEQERQKELLGYQQALLLQKQQQQQLQQQQLQQQGLSQNLLQGMGLGTQASSQGVTAIGRSLGVGAGGQAGPSLLEATILQLKQQQQQQQLQQQHQQQQLQQQQLLQQQELENEKQLQLTKERLQLEVKRQAEELEKHLALLQSLDSSPSAAATSTLSQVKALAKGLSMSQSTESRESQPRSILKKPKELTPEGLAQELQTSDMERRQRLARGIKEVRGKGQVNYQSVLEEYEKEFTSLHKPSDRPRSSATETSRRSRSYAAMPFSKCHSERLDYQHAQTSVSDESRYSTPLRKERYSPQPSDQYSQLTDLYASQVEDYDHGHFREQAYADQLQSSRGLPSQPQLVRDYGHTERYRDSMPQRPMDRKLEYSSGGLQGRVETAGLRARTQADRQLEEDRLAQGRLLGAERGRLVPGNVPPLAAEEKMAAADRQHLAQQKLIASSSKQGSMSGSVPLGERQTGSQLTHAAPSSQYKPPAGSQLSPADNSQYWSAACSQYGTADTNQYSSAASSQYSDAAGRQYNAAASGQYNPGGGQYGASVGVTGNVGARQQAEPQFGLHQITIRYSPAGGTGSGYTQARPSQKY